MKSIMITAPSSNTGKTIITLGIIRALTNRGIEISAFKTGPDYIDRDYLEKASGRRAGNLDIHMMTEDGIKSSLAMGSGDLAVVEGAMGYFDGIANSFENSSYDMSKRLDINAILVYSPKGEMFSMIPKIKGMVDFQDSRIKAIILNKTSQAMYEMLKGPIEEYIGIKVLGYLPKDDRLSVASSSLGLVGEFEDGYSSELMDLAAQMIEDGINLDQLLELCSEAKVGQLPSLEKKNIKIALAKDEAFSFHYNENIYILGQLGQIEYFSPLRDQALPDADLVIIGGGYPELYLKELSSNQAMKDSIRAYVEAGGYLIAESAGLMYMTEYIDSYPMVGIFKGRSETRDRLARFGYVNMEMKHDSIYGKAGKMIYGNEYHKSEFLTELKEEMTIKKPRRNRGWECGYSYKNSFGYYQHINYLGNLDAIDYLTDLLKKES